MPLAGRLLGRSPAACCEVAPAGQTARGAGREPPVGSLWAGCQHAAPPQKPRPRERRKRRSSAAPRHCWQKVRHGRRSRPHPHPVPAPASVHPSPRVASAPLFALPLRGPSLAPLSPAAAAALLRQLLRLLSRPPSGPRGPRPATGSARGRLAARRRAPAPPRPPPRPRPAPPHPAAPAAEKRVSGSVGQGRGKGGGEGGEEDEEVQGIIRSQVVTRHQNRGLIESCGASDQSCRWTEGPRYPSREVTRAAAEQRRQRGAEARAGAAGAEAWAGAQAGARADWGRTWGAVQRGICRSRHLFSGSWGQPQLTTATATAAGATPTAVGAPP